jgi:hypothetical protein
MAEESTERFEMDFEPSERYYRQGIPALIKHARARTANLVALVLVVGLVLSLPAFLVAVLVKPESLEVTQAIFEKWFSVVGPIVGTAIGAYYGARQSGKGDSQ